MCTCVCEFMCERDLLHVCAYACVIVRVCLHACRCMVVVMMDEWIGRCIVYNCPVARITAILTSTSPFPAAS